MPLCNPSHVHLYALLSTMHVEVNLPWYTHNMIILIHVLLQNILLQNKKSREKRSILKWCEKLNILQGILI